MPVDAERKGGSGNPQAKEDDPFASDPMGPGTPDSSGDTASVDVENKGGNLSGPNGDVQNGFGEGSCIEVKMCWTYKFQVTIKTCVGSQVPTGYGGSVSGSDCVSVTVWWEGKVCSPAQSVCPCWTVPLPS